MRLPTTAAIVRWLGGMIGAAWLLATPLVAQVPAGFEQGVFDLRLARNDGVTSPVLVGPSGRLLVPLAPILALSGVTESGSQGDSLRRTPGPGGSRDAVMDLVGHFHGFSGPVEHEAFSQLAGRRIAFDSTSGCW